MSENKFKFRAYALQSLEGHELQHLRKARVPFSEPHARRLGLWPQLFCGNFAKIDGFNMFQQSTCGVPLIMQVIFATKVSSANGG